MQSTDRGRPVCAAAASSALASHRRGDDDLCAGRWASARAEVMVGAHRRDRLRRLAALRATRGLTQEEVARRMRTTQSAVARLERGDSDVRLSTLELYSAALGMSFEWAIAAGSGPE